MIRLDLTDEIINRFWNNVNKEGPTSIEGLGPCWEWKLRIDKDGYGNSAVNSKSYLSHRISYIISIGDIPDGYSVTQNCKNRKCVNPEHLEALTKKEAMLRGNSPAALNSAKTHCKRGHLLSDNNVRLVKMKNGDFGKACKTCETDYRKQRIENNKSKDV